MRRVKKSGFAGVPGFSLDQSDVRHLAAFFGREEALSSPALSGIGNTGSEGCVVGCAPGVNLSDKVASRVFREMGSTQLAQIAVDGKPTEILQLAGSVASGISNVIKFSTDKFAVLGQLTSPMFAQTVKKTSVQFRGIKEPDRSIGAMTFCYMIGIADVKAGRKSFYADAYRKSAQGLSELLEEAGKSPEYAGKAKQLSEQLAGFGSWSVAVTGPWAATEKNALLSDTGSGVADYTPGYWGGRATETAERSAQAALNKYTSYYQQLFAPDSSKIRDVGTATRSPASIDLVDPVGVVVDLWQILVHGAQTAQVNWTQQPKPYGSDQKAAITAAKTGAQAILNNQKDGKASTPTRLLTAWIIQHYADRVSRYNSSGIAKEDWDLFRDKSPWFPVLVSWESQNYEAKSSGAKGAWWNRSFFQPGWTWNKNVSSIGDDYARTGVGLYTHNRESGEYRGVASGMFMHQCLIAYWALVNKSNKQVLLDTLSNGASEFPAVVGAAMALARWDALERSGQIGRYDGFAWVPDPAGGEMVPQGTDVYADWFAKAGPDEVDVRWDAVPFVLDVYKARYKREPTKHALGWYARMGYGLGTKWYDLSPDDTKKYAAAITQTTRFEGQEKTPEDARVAGAEIGADDAKNRSNWFVIFGKKISEVLSNVIEAMQAGLDAATALICKIFKWMFGDSVGGIICGVINTLLRFAMGSVLGATAALFAILKALSEFIGHLMNKEWMKALYSLFLGVNQAIFFTIGSPIITMLAGDTGRMSLLKSQEAKERKKVRDAGGNPDDVVFPSLESLAEKLTKEDPFFIFSVIFPVIALAVAPNPVTAQKAGGQLVLALCPVIGIFLAPQAMKWIKESKEPAINQYKALPREKIEQAITQICKIIALVVMTVITFAQALAMLKERWAAFAKRKGGTGSAIRSTIGFFFQRLGAELTLMVGSLSIAVKTGFKNPDGSPSLAMQIFTETSKSFFSKLPGVIIAFATEELGVEGAELQKFTDMIQAGVNTAQEARAAFDELKKILGPEQTATFIEVVPETPARTAESKKQKETNERSRRLLPLLGVAAGLAVGFALFSGDGKS